MFTPNKVDLTIYQGASYQQAWQLVDKITGDPIDLTGYTAKMQIRGKIKDDVTILDLTTTNGGIAITVTEDMTTLSLYASALATSVITASKGIYDLELIDTSGDVYRLMQGTVTISQEVTR